MNFDSLTRIGPTGLISITVGGLIAGVSFTAQKASAQTSAVNPCPSIYYEEPFDTNVMTPEGCPPNTLTQFLLGGQGTPPSDSQPIPGQGGTAPPQGDVPLETEPAPSTDEPSGETPYPYEPYEQGGVATDLSPIAVVPPTNGMVDVRLMNATNALITYEVTGETERRYLQAQEEVTLQNIPLPATITTVRQDEGLVDIIPVSSDNSLLELSIEEEQELDDTQGVIRIQPDGQVFVN